MNTARECYTRLTSNRRQFLDKAVECSELKVVIAGHTPRIRCRPLVPSQTVFSRKVVGW